MKKWICIALACTFVSCSQLEDRPDAKQAAFKRVAEYCKENSKNGVVYKADNVASATVQSNEGL